jgi:hypothetical protein
MLSNFITPTISNKLERKISTSQQSQLRIAALRSYSMKMSKHQMNPQKINQQMPETNLQTEGPLTPSTLP